jgi:hypothetical protein
MNTDEPNYENPSDSDFLNPKFDCIKYVWKSNPGESRLNKFKVNECKIKVSNLRKEEERLNDLLDQIEMKTKGDSNQSVKFGGKYRKRRTAKRMRKGKGGGSEKEKIENIINSNKDKDLFNYWNDDYHDKIGLNKESTVWGSDSKDENGKTEEDRIYDFCQQEAKKIFDSRISRQYRLACANYIVRNRINEIENNRKNEAENKQKESISLGGKYRKKRTAKRMRKGKHGGKKTTKRRKSNRRKSNRRK